MITLRGDDDRAVDAALGALESALSARVVPASGVAGVAPARTVRSAAAAHPDAPLVLLSVPGSAVLGEALDAIGAGRHVMIFSDNVPLADEIVLKDAAAAAGVLVMGPDCGTAIISGVGLGFANVLQDNGSAPRVGIVAASGTGAQQLTCLLDDAGVAVSHVLGVGGRDLSEAVGGRSAAAALRMLDADPSTDHIVLICKPPHPATAAAIGRVAQSLGTPVSTIAMGLGQPDITASAEAVLRELGVAVPRWQSWAPQTAEAGTVGAAGSLRGLFSGGTLADEAMVVAGAVLGDIRSNIPLRPDLALPSGTAGHGVPRLTGLGHVVIDLGDDEFTLGRPHPMIDPTLRLDLLADQAADPEVAVLLLDVVLGHAADPDPALRLAPAIRNAIASAATAGRSLSVVVALCGTMSDPQDRGAQAAALVAAGARVFASNAAAARAAAGMAAGAGAGSALRRPAPPPGTAPAAASTEPIAGARGAPATRRRARSAGRAGGRDLRGDRPAGRRAARPGR